MDRTNLQSQQMIRACRPDHPAGARLGDAGCGASFLLCDIGYWMGGEQHPLAAAEYILGMLSETV